MDIWTFLFLVVGLVFLVFGAEWLVKGASSVASKMGIAPVVIGLTVVAFGTSAPELAVSVNGALTGSADVALGNVVGSNTFNILLILGLSAAISGLAIQQRLLRLDIPILFAVSVVTYLLVLDNSVSRIEGVILFCGGLVYTWWLLKAAKSPESGTVVDEYAEEVDTIEGADIQRPVVFHIGLILAGLALLVLGSRFLVGSATEIAEHFGISELVIGLTVVAGGTSLPELATSVMAAIRGQRDIAVGNVVGSNIFNTLIVLGASSAVAPDGISVTSEVLRLDLPVMLAATFVLIPICWNGFMIKRWEGFLLAAFYVAYVAYLVMEAGDSTAPELFRTAMLIIVPLVIATYMAAGFQGWRQHRQLSQR